MQKLKIIKEILLLANFESKRSGKSKFYLFFDIIQARLKYGFTCVDYKTFGLALIAKKYRSEIVSSHQFSRFVHENCDFSNDQKWASYKLFKEFYKRDMILLGESSAEEITNFLNKHEVFFAKTPNGGCGRGVIKVDRSDFPNQEACLSYLRQKGNLLLEEAIKQHEKMSFLNESSVNTLRIATVMNEAGEVLLLPAIVRIGSPGSIVDNIASGGRYLLLDDKGRSLLDEVFQNDSSKTDLGKPLVELRSGLRLKSYQIPFFEEACEMVRQAAYKIKDNYTAGFDIAITEEGPVMVELNTYHSYDLLQNYYFAKALGKEHSGFKLIFEKHTGKKFYK